MIRSINDFTEYLSKLKTPDKRSINIYAGKSEESIARRKNLLSYLKMMESIVPDTILIGEAPGYHGCAKTGIAFTDEMALATESMFEDDQFRNFGLDSERSAAVIWNILRTKQQMPLLWNIYPFYPFGASIEKNRTPNAKEVQMGRDILMELLYLFKVKHIYCIGKSSYNALKDVIPDAIYVRHPSHGGIKECTETLNNLLI